MAKSYGSININGKDVPLTKEKLPNLTFVPKSEKERVKKENELERERRRQENLEEFLIVMIKSYTDLLSQKKNLLNLDLILDKIYKTGIKSLSCREQEFLDTSSKII